MRPGATLRRVAINGLWAYLLQATNLLVSLVTLPYLTRVLGKAGFGTFASALNLVTYLTIVTVWGFDMWGSREVARASDPGEIRSLFRRIVLARTLLLAASLVPFAIMAATSQGRARTALLAMGLTLVGLTYGQTWLFLGTQQLRLAALSALISKGLFLAAVLLLVKTPADAIRYCVLYGASLVLSAGIQEWLARRTFQVSLGLASLGDVWGVIRAAAPLFLANIMSTIANGIGVTALTARASAAQVGEYAGVLRIASTLLLLFAPIWTALYPQACRRYDVSRAVGNGFALRVSALLIPTFAVLSLGVVVLRDPLVRTVLGRDYADAGGVVVPLMVWVFVGIVCNVIGTQVLVASGRQRQYTVGLVVATAATAVFTIVGVGAGPIGVGWATAAGQVVLLACLVGAIWTTRRMPNDSGGAYLVHDPDAVATTSSPATLDR